MPRANETLTSEATRCDDCVQWLEHCHAECCREFTFHPGPNIDVKFGDGEVRLALRLTADLRRYYELHGAHVIGRFLVVPRESCHSLPDRLRVTMECSALRDDYLCSLHPDRKPDVCRGLTWETAQDSGYVLTPHCLFALKAGRVSGG